VPVPLRPLLLAALLAPAALAAEPGPSPAAPPSTAEAPAPSPEGASTAAAEKAPRPPWHALPFTPPLSDEAMNFQVSYLGVPMGKVRLFSGKVDASTAPIFLQAQTTSVFAIVTLKQQLSSYIDVATGLPRSGSLDAVEGSYRHTDTALYDRATNKATVREKGKFDNTYVVDIPPDTLDFVSLVYRLRSLPLPDGQKYDFHVLAGRDVNSIGTQVLGREEVETKAGKFRAVKVRVPTGFTGKFSERNPTFVWFSDDERRIVVRITADFSIGNATANLTGYTPGTPPPAATPSPVPPPQAGASAAVEPSP
jgi:hypothetical protein